jgi:hypothetical protein
MLHTVLIHHDPLHRNSIDALLGHVLDDDPLDIFDAAALPVLEDFALVADALEAAVSWVNKGDIGRGWVGGACAGVDASLRGELAANVQVLVFNILFFDNIWIWGHSWFYLEYFA